MPSPAVWGGVLQELCQLRAWVRMGNISFVLGRIDRTIFSTVFGKVDKYIHSASVILLSVRYSASNLPE